VPNFWISIRTTSDPPIKVDGGQVSGHCTRGRYTTKNGNHAPFLYYFGLQTVSAPSPTVQGTDPDFFFPGLVRNRRFAYCTAVHIGTRVLLLLTETK
jgi:hypothetical protein